ncbi:MAG: 2-oxo acid dehydrogenase subunit E2, partial [Acidimicrobiia bacterium]|nr:2-oxo acid dehydrogenase subunit E2 [Acidimicrobiia bacterium]NNC92373.1 2-oxo acid dehydrogenase subunit E2 [Acidimicrobiia bacterium]
MQWLVEVGDPVGVDQPLAEIETDKAVTDISSPFAGVVLYRGAEDGATLRVGEILVVVGYEGEEWTPPHDGQEGAEAAPVVGTLADEAMLLGASDDDQADPAGDRPKALPLVRKLAREHGINLEDIHGSGPHGRITRDDVQAYLDGPPPDKSPADSEEPVEEVVVAEPEPPSAGNEPEEPDAEHGGDTDRVPMSRLRRTIADRMSRSWSEIPHVTAFDSADATRLIAARRALANRAETAMPIEALIIKAVIPALRAFPEFNASIDNDDLILKRYYNVGVAIDTDEGLIVPVVKNAGDMGVADLAALIDSLAGSARSRQLSTGDLSGVTFTVSNIGAVGGGFGTPIVPFGTTAILSVGRADEQPVVRDGKLTSAVMMPLSLSYDHRVID